MAMTISINGFKINVGVFGGGLLYKYICIYIEEIVGKH